MFLDLMLPISNFICFRVKVFFLSCSSNVSSRFCDVHNAVYASGTTNPSFSILGPRAFFNKFLLGGGAKWRKGIQYQVSVEQHPFTDTFHIA